MDEPVAVAKCCTHSIMLAMLPHRVVVPATNAWLFRTSTTICPNWCVPSCKPRAEIASVTRTRPITTDDSYLLLFLLQHNRLVFSLLWISLHMHASSSLFFNICCYIPAFYVAVNKRDARLEHSLTIYNYFNLIKKLQQKWKKKIKMQDDILKVKNTDAAHLAL